MQAFPLESISANVSFPVSLLHYINTQDITIILCVYVDPSENNNTRRSVKAWSGECVDEIQ